LAERRTTPKNMAKDMVVNFFIIKLSFGTV